MTAIAMVCVGLMICRGLWEISGKLAAIQKVLERIADADEKRNADSDEGWE